MHIVLYNITRILYRYIRTRTYVGTFIVLAYIFWLYIIERPTYAFDSNPTECVVPLLVVLV